MSGRSLGKTLMAGGGDLLEVSSLLCVVPEWNEVSSLVCVVPEWNDSEAGLSCGSQLEHAEGFRWLDALTAWQLCSQKEQPENQHIKGTRQKLQCRL